MDAVAHGIHLVDFLAADDERSRLWERTVRQGYQDSDPSDEKLRWLLRSYATDGATLAGAYLDDAGIDGQVLPVGTFATVPGTVNLGRGPISASLIASVGVRPTHRRRGLLRTMMQHSLDFALTAGVPIALLTASEGSIYERFGFGVSVWRVALRIDTRNGLSLRRIDPGSVQQVDASWVFERAPAIFNDFHAQTFGSVTRRSDFLGNRLFAPDTEQISNAIRAAVHLNASGHVDGYAFYRATSSFSHTLEIVDLISVTNDAYFGLWNFLGNFDLVDTLIYNQAMLDEPIRWGVTNPRSIAVTEVQDELWARILDPAAVLSSRRYRTGITESVSLEIRDQLGYAAGRFRLNVENGHATANPVQTSDMDTILDVAALGTLLLGAATPTQLAIAGQLTATSPAALERLDTIFATTSNARFYSHF